MSGGSYLSNCAPHVNVAVDYLIDFMRIADEYLLEDVKNHCQNELINLIDETTYQTISEMGELYNADRIVEYCQWFQRRKLQHYDFQHHSHDIGSMNSRENSLGSMNERNSQLSILPQKSKK